MTRIAQSSIVRDVFAATVVVASSAATLHYGMSAARAEREAHELRSQHDVLAERLLRFETAFHALDSQVLAAGALTRPDAALSERLASGELATPASLGVLDESLAAAASAKAASRVAAVYREDPSDAARMAYQLALIDGLERELDGLGHRLDGLTAGLRAQASLVRTVPSIMPVDGEVSSEFGVRLSPFEGRRSMHAGLDIAAETGSVIVAPADGQVTFVGEFDDLGRAIVIDHGNGVLTRYGHTSAQLVKAGAKVRRGQKIGLVGTTGHSTGPHLHYEIWVHNAPVDPRPFLFEQPPQAAVAAAAKGDRPTVQGAAAVRVAATAMGGER
jgi:murein DD-endopeptidase MepM/ murein hydrolase activator NlpD